MPEHFTTLAEAAAWHAAWLEQAALPLWADAGVDAGRGSFQEALTVEGEPRLAPRRSRVQTRQVWVYASAAAEGLGEHYGALARRAFGFYLAHYRRPDGLYAREAGIEGAITDATAVLYEQAFALLAMSAIERLDPGSAAPEALALRAAMAPLRHATGGFRETGDHPFQANAHMHLLEASLAWAERGGAGWSELCDEIAELALSRFVDRQAGVLHEFFDADWRPLSDAAGGLVEPGHQFEWAWLLNRWGRARGREDARDVAKRLYATGLRGVDPGSGIVMNALWSDLGVRDRAARLWTQTEYLKTALMFGDDAQALRAARGLASYLETPRPGTWRDKREAGGGFVEEPAPATSFYHLLGAILPLRARRA
jgi:mannose-6-phosphate isomerase